MAVALFTGTVDGASRVLVVKDRLAVGIQLEDLIAGGNEGIAVAQTDGGHRMVVDLPFPEDLPAPVALGDSVGPELGDQNAAGPQQLHVGRTVEPLDTPAQVSATVEGTDAAGELADAVNLADDGESRGKSVLSGAGEVGL